MPGAGVKNLYLAKSLKELNKLTDTPIQDVKNIKIACSSARKVYNEAKSCQQLGDEEKSYVLFMRYFSLVKSIRKTVEYQKNKEYFDKLMGEQSFNETMTSAEKLSASLSKRYGVLQESKKSEEKETNKSPSLSEKENIEQKQTIIESNHTKPLFHEQTNGERELIGDGEVKKENSITSQKLYELFMDSSVSLLIMDARPSKDFLNSHIKHSFCINVPSEILKPGITAVGLTKSIPEDFLFQWNQRNLVDFIVILDWNSTENSVKMGSPLHSLCEAIWKWDSSKILKSKPLILEGGYKDWLLRYPMLTTNANVTAPNLDLSISSAVLSNKLVSEVDYPNLDEALSESSDSLSSVQDNTTFTIKFQDFSLKPINISPPVVNRSTKPSSLTEITDKKKAFFKERVDRSSFDSVSIDKSSGPENKNSSLINVQIPDRKLKPKSTSSASCDSKLSFDRLSSPVKSSAEQDREQELQIKEHAVAEESLEIAKEQLEKEKQFEALRLKRACEAEEGMRLELQKQEEALLERINALEEEKRKKDIEMQKIQDYCENMRQQLKKHEQQKSEEEERLSQIEATKKTILQETERLRRERKQKEKEKEEHRKQKEKEKHDMEMREKTHLKSQEDSAHTKALSKHATGRPNSAKEGEYIVRLKEDEGLSTKHGLSRSHSSPNIAQMIAEENDQSVKARMPQYDRSLKPRNEISSSPSHYGGKLVELNAARLRNLTPVYGNQGQAGTGLKNLGNTCFMNSVLQCLVNTTTLAIHFISGQYKRQINVENKQGTRGELAEEFAVIVTAMWTGQYRSVAPKDFKNAVGKHIPGFLGYEQQDSHEFLVMLLEKLHGDLNRVNFKAKSKLPDLDDIPDSIAVTRFWDYHISHNSSIIGDEFEGLLQSTLTCLFCKKISSSYEVFSCLSIPIPSGNRCTIKDCLQLFLRTEQMSGEGAWDCPRCKQKRDAEKKLAICKLPQILIIHLKRFSYEGMWRRKLQNYVDFPLTDFDLKPYVNMSVTKSYNLYGVTNHYGTLEGGHYIAHVKTSINEKWYKYDDQEVSEMSPADVKTSAAYILFYTSVDLRAPLHASLKV